MATVAEHATVVTFRVNGDPGTQGSWIAMLSRSTGRPIAVQSDSAHLREWRAAVARAAREAGAVEVESGPVAVSMVFHMPRPARVPPERLGTPSIAPDIDKLVRAALDALSGRPGRKGAARVQGACFADDGQVTALLARKRYVAPGEYPGATITVWRLVGDAIQAALLEPIP